jgi:4-amino-4-deoxy-L-arabinose transferase-like glycosyltransferase
MRTGRTTACLLALLGAALAMRLAAGWVWQSQLPQGSKFGFGDSESYWRLAECIANGANYEYGPERARVFRAPGYPVLLAGLFNLRGGEPPVWHGRVLSAALMTLCVGGVFWLATELFDRRTGLLAAALAAVYPGGIALAALVLSEAAFCALLPVQLVLWVKGCRTSSSRWRVAWFLAAGVVAGLATLVRPSWLLFTPLAVLVSVVPAHDRRRNLLAGAWLMLGLVIAMTPWWIRNAQVAGRFVPTTLQVGASLYDGLNAHADGGSNMAFVSQVVADFHREHPNAPADQYEYELNRYFRQQAVAWAGEHPGRVLQLAGIKFVRMWNIWPNEPQFRRWPIQLTIAATYTPLLVLGLWGGVRVARRGWPYALCLLPAAYLTLMHVVFVSSLRYRIPPMLILIVPAAGLIGGWIFKADDANNAADQPYPSG